MEASFVLHEEKMSRVLFEAAFTSDSTSLKLKTLEFEGCPSKVPQLTHVTRVQSKIDKEFMYGKMKGRKNRITSV